MATEAVAAREISETAPTMSPDDAKAAGGTARPRGWLRRLVLVPREYLPRSRRWSWRLAAAAAEPPAAGGRGPSRLASTLSRSLRWKQRLPAFSSLGLKGGSAAAVVDAVTFRVMYVVEAVVLGLGLSCFFLCCGCHL